jgi:hypothetical protein
MQLETVRFQWSTDRTTRRRYVKRRQPMGHRHRRIAELQLFQKQLERSVGVGCRRSTANTTQTLIMRWSSYSIIMRGRALTLLCRLMQFVCNTRRDATNELCMSYAGSIRGSKLSSQQLNRGFQFNTMIFGKAERRAANFPVLSPDLTHWGGCQQQ